jgi:tRNA 2-thiouridine synthesizing protein B
MLHLVFQSPLQTATLQRIGCGHPVLLLENAVLCLLKQSQNAAQISDILTQHRMYVLQSDIETRGIAVDALIAGIEVIDYPQWVALTVEYPQVFSWF